jgi:hypothetical protein
MPARQGFQFDPMAAKAQIGYGAAQVVDPGYGQIIDADAKRRQLELAEAKYKKEQEDKNKPSLIEAGKLVPALVPKAQEAIADYYKDYRENSHTWDNATKMEKEANIRNFIQSMRTASDMAFEKNKAHDPEKLAFNQEMVENMFNADYLSGKANDEIDWTAIFGGINANYEIESVNLMDRIKSLTPLAGYNADKREFDVRLKDGTTKKTKRDEVTNELAKDILRQDYKQMDSVQLANVQYKYDRLSPEEKKKYGSPEEYYIRDENSQLLAYKRTATDLAGTPDDGGGTGRTLKDLTIDPVEGTAPIQFSLGGDKKSLGEVALVNQQALNPIRGEEKNITTSIGKYYDAETGKWTRSADELLFRPLAVSDAQVYTGRTPLTTGVTDLDERGDQIILKAGETWNEEEPFVSFVEKLDEKGNVIKTDKVVVNKGEVLGEGGDLVKMKEVTFKNGDFIPVKQMMSGVQNELSKKEGDLTGWKRVVQGVTVKYDQWGNEEIHKIIIPEDEQNVTTFNNLRKGRAHLGLYENETSGTVRDNLPSLDSLPDLSK